MCCLGGMSAGTHYYVILGDNGTIQLAASQSDAEEGKAIDQNLAAAILDSVPHSSPYRAAFERALLKPRWDHLQQCFASGRVFRA